MSERPSTSKPRGVCKYYRQRRGCLNGDMCKFLHGDGETLSPYDKSKVCKYYAAGFCRNGSGCWFKHIDAPRAAPVAEISSPPESAGQQSQDSEDEKLCCICQEEPVTYGLLESCSHIFCLECARVWRDPDGKTPEIIQSGNTKKCPYCRTPSKFVTPSSVFYPSGDDRKTEAITRYKVSMSRIPCKYFEESSPHNRFCPFGRDCFYQHAEADGSPYVFPHGASYYMSRRRSRRSHAARRVHVPEERSEGDLIQTLSELRSHLEEIHFEPPSDQQQWDSSTETFISRIVYNVMDALEETVRTWVSEGENSGPGDRTEDTGNDVFYSASARSLQEIRDDAAVATREPVLSPLPFTRTFMDSRVSVEENESDAIDPDLPATSLRSSPLRWLSFWGEDDGTRSNAWNSNGHSIPFLGRDRSNATPLIITINSDSEDEEQGDDSSSLSSSHELSSRSSSSLERTSCTSAADTQVSIASGDNKELRSHEVRNKSVQTADSADTPTSDSRSKQHNGNDSSDAHRTSARRHETSGFVTDGRGRVIAMDDSKPSGSDPHRAPFFADDE